MWVTHTEGPNETSDPVTRGPKMTFRFAEGLCYGLEFPTTENSRSKEGEGAN